MESEQLNLIEDLFNTHNEIIKDIKNTMISDIQKVANIITSAILKNNKVIICGNGGSAATAQHIVGEFVCKFLLDREPFPAIALSTNTSNMTAISNDYGYEYVFSRQLQSISNKGDVLIAISTSGESNNITMEMEKAKKQGLKIIGLKGSNYTKMNEICDISINILSKSTPRI